MASNFPPRSGIRVPPDEMRGFVTRLFENAGTSHEDAGLMGAILVNTDLWGMFSHGTRLASLYIDKMLAGLVNPRPIVRSVREHGATRIFDGDGGLGHFACYHGTQWAIGEAKDSGLAAFTTRNHFHFGAAGSFSRMALEHDCIGVAISSRRIELDPEKTVVHSILNSPISVAVPSNEQPPLVMDMGASLPRDRRLFERYPKIFFKIMALGSVLHALGGILAGVYEDEVQASQSGWESGQGAFIAVLDVGRFVPVDEFKKEMDRYIGEARRMRPLPGQAAAELAGGPEWHQEREYTRSGIPVGVDHEKQLREVAARLGVETPFSKFEHTRFGRPRRREQSLTIDVGRRMIRYLTSRFLPSDRL